MILFLNFAPISFGGGAEKWVVSVADSLQKIESVVIMHVDTKLANIYSKLVLGRNFDNRITNSLKNLQIVPITAHDLITSKFSNNRISKLLREARIIYSRYELNEYILLTMFGTSETLKKTVFGLHSPFRYTDDRLNFLQSLHNWLYLGQFSKKALSQSKKIHVLNAAQEEMLKHHFGLTNITRIPNYIESTPEYTPITNTNTLRICFIGELSKRKGADVLFDLIKKAPNHYTFTIAGDGRLKDKFSNLQSPNVRYLGFLNSEQIQNVLASSDVLFMPSKAESFSLSCLEALSHGLPVVVNKQVSLQEINEYLHVNNSGSVDEYLDILDALMGNKKTNQLEKTRKLIWKEVNSSFSKRTILKQLKETIFLN